MEEATGNAMTAYHHSTSAVVLAAGSSIRMGMGQNKVLLEIEGRSLIEYSLEVFADLDEVSEIMLVVSAADREFFTGDYGERLARLGVKKIITGGARRFDSAMEGVEACDPDAKLVLIHDGARPFPPKHAIQEAIRKAGDLGGAILAVPVLDTLKCRGEGGLICKTVPREGLFRAQTPQVFQRSLLKAAMDDARARGLDPTDDARLFEDAGHPVALVESDFYNLKVTTPDDLLLARAICKIKQEMGAIQ